MAATPDTPGPRLPPEILSHVACYADHSARLALLYSGWTGYAAVLPHLYAEVALSESLTAGLKHNTSVGYPLTHDGVPKAWPNDASHKRKRAALACVRRLRNRPCHVDVTTVLAPYLNRVRAVVFEPGASMEPFFSCTSAARQFSPPAVCIYVSSSQLGGLGWFERMISLDVSLAALPALAVAFTRNRSITPTPLIKPITLHGFDLRIPSKRFTSHRFASPVRLWPRPTRSLWTETPWEDNVSDWETFLASMPAGKYELVVPHEPLTCHHTGAYAAAAFYLRVLLRMEMNACPTNKDVTMPFGVQCACGETKQEIWCSEPLLATLKDEGFDDAEMIERIRARDARLPLPPAGPCKAHIWDVSDMAAAAEKRSPGAYAAARAEVANALVEDARAVLRREG